MEDANRKVGKIALEVEDLRTLNESADGLKEEVSRLHTECDDFKQKLKQSKIEASNLQNELDTG